MEGEQMQYDLNRLDVTIMQVLEQNGADNHSVGMTITEVLDALLDIGIVRSRWSFYRRLGRMVQNGYVEKGVLENHADTYYLVQKGRDFLKGEN